MTQRGKSSTPSWWKVAAAYALAVPALTIVVIVLRWPPLIGLGGAALGAAIVYRWQP